MLVISGASIPAISRLIKDSNSSVNEPYILIASIMISIIGVILIFDRHI